MTGTMFTTLQRLVENSKQNGSVLDCFTCLWLEVELLGIFSIQNLPQVREHSWTGMVSVFPILKEVYNEKKVQKVADLGHFLFSDRGDRGFSFNFFVVFSSLKFLCNSKLIEDTG